MDKARVFFVGAGPGAADLITVRGMRIISESDVIIYAGSLVNPELLKYAKQGAEIHNSAYMTLEEVITVMGAAAKSGKTVCRLHTGDPSLYGAVREQMDALDELGLGYESCPGVSAAFGAAASMDLEYTLPGLSQSLVITRMEGRTEVPAKESIEGWAAHGATMAIYLSAGMVSELTDRLITGGYSEDTPAAIIYKATWPEEEYYYCRLSDLPAAAEEHNITRTALILVGEVIGKSGYNRSKLYDSSFATGFRNAKESPEGR
ncbi:MAG: precorrin-4 C(11)-methyltransferase [Mogibacterium sp.]|nr:precorrin-4 C(11)-methyltransferase [Mogibacterium sp.]